MKKLIIVVLLSVSINAFSQKENPKQDTVKVKLNELQIKRINELQIQISELQNKLAFTLEVITGVKQEDIESLREDKGVLIVIKKKQ